MAPMTENNAADKTFLALQALGVKENDEIIVQAFTCVALINPILFQKAKPIFCDINETLNIDVEDLKNKITKKRISKIRKTAKCFGSQTVRVYGRNRADHG